MHFKISKMYQPVLKMFKIKPRPQVNSNNLGPSAGTPSRLEVGTDAVTAADAAWLTDRVENLVPLGN